MRLMSNVFCRTSALAAASTVALLAATAVGLTSAHAAGSCAAILKCAMQCSSRACGQACIDPCDFEANNLAVALTDCFSACSKNGVDAEACIDHWCASELDACEADTCSSNQGAPPPVTDGNSMSCDGLFDCIALCDGSPGCEAVCYEGTSKSNQMKAVALAQCGEAQCSGAFGSQHDACLCDECRPQQEACSGDPCDPALEPLPWEQGGSRNDDGDASGAGAGVQSGMLPPPPDQGCGAAAGSAASPAIFWVLMALVAGRGAWHLGRRAVAASAGRKRGHMQHVVPRFPPVLLAIGFMASTAMGIGRELDPDQTYHPILSKLAAALDALGIDVVRETPLNKLQEPRKEFVMADLSLLDLPTSPTRQQWMDEFEAGASGMILAVSPSSSHPRGQAEPANSAWDAISFARTWWITPTDGRVVISFARHDREMASRIASVLSEAGYVVFIYLREGDRTPWVSAEATGFYFASAGHRLVLDSPAARRNAGVQFERRWLQQWFDSKPEDQDDEWRDKHLGIDGLIDDDTWRNGHLGGDSARRGGRSVRPLGVQNRGIMRLIRRGLK